MGLLRRAGFDPFALARLRRVLIARRPAVVVAHGGEPLKYAVLSAGRVPLVYLKIGQAQARARRGLRRRWHRWLVRRADVVVGVSEEVAVEAVEVFGAAASSVRVIPNGRDPKVFRSNPDRPLGEPPLILFVGHMTESKRPEVFLDVLGRLQTMGVVVQGRMLGDGDLLDAIRERGNELGVEVLGGRDDVASQLAAADLFLFTSIPDGEGMPGVLIEAAMSGLPIVTTQVPGASDVVLHERTGIIVDPEEPDELEALTRACVALLADRERRAQMGSQASEWVRERFALNVGAARWERLFHELCGGSRSGGAAE